MINDLGNTAFWIVVNKSINVDVVPMMKTTGVVENWTLYIFYWVKVSLNLCFAVSFINIYMYICT